MCYTKVMSLTKLESFVKYCSEHPEERFWQALRNWSGANYIIKSSHYDADMFDIKFLDKHIVRTSDTFYEDDNYDDKYNNIFK